MCNVATFASMEETITYSNKVIKEKDIENYLLNNLDKELSNFIAKVSVIPNTKKINNTPKIKSLEKKINKLKDLYLDDLINKETYAKDYKKYTSELLSLKNTTTQEPLKKDYSHLKQILNSDYKKIYYELNKTNKKKFWFSFINKIYVENGEIKEITFL